MPVPDRRAIYKYRKMIKQQVPAWAVRQHAEDTCSVRWNWTKFMLDWRNCQENTWLDLHRKRSGRHHQHKMQHNFSIGIRVKTDVVHNLHGRDLAARLNFVNYDLHGYVSEKQAPHSFY